MSRRRRRPASEGAIASVEGGAVTSERLLAAARREGHDASPLVLSLLAQSLPSTSDLARVYATSGGVPRLDSSFIKVSPKAARLIDAKILREHGCLPVAIMDGLCILAVMAGRAEDAVRVVRAALQRDVLPVVADPGTLREALSRLAAPPPGVRLGIMRRRESPTQSRFRSLVIGGEALDATRLADGEVR